MSTSQEELVNMLSGQDFNPGGHRSDWAGIRSAEGMIKAARGDANIFESICDSMAGIISQPSLYGWGVVVDIIHLATHYALSDGVLRGGILSIMIFDTPQEWQSIVEIVKNGYIECLINELENPNLSFMRPIHPQEVIPEFVIPDSSVQIYTENEFVNLHPGAGLTVFGVYVLPPGERSRQRGFGMDDILGFWCEYCNGVLARYPHAISNSQEFKLLCTKCGHIVYRQELGTF